MHLDHGPRENRSRPAIDPLFRSAALAFDKQVCGVVLSGHLDDGSEGLRLVAAKGGLAIVQDPGEAPHPEMPLNALRQVPEAEVLSAVRIGRRVADLDRVRAPAGHAHDGALPAPAALLDVQVGARDPDALPSGLTCPECGGVLWADPDNENVHCRVGHRYSLEALAGHAVVSVEQSMWAAVRALREDASLAEHMALRARAHGSEHTAARFDRRSREASRHAEVLRRLLLERDP